MQEPRLDSWLSYSVRREYLDRDLEFARSAMRARVLEIGAGRNGRRGKFVPPIAECDWMYVDLESDRGPNVVASVENLPFTDSAYDAVVALEMLEYTNHPVSALRELRRVLKTDGVLTLSVPFFHRQDTDHDFWRLTEAGLRQLISEAGLQVVWIRPQGYALAVIANVIKHAVYVQPTPVRRLIFGALMWPVVKALLSLDGRLARRFATLSTFSTGYLTVAKRQ